MTSLLRWWCADCAEGVDGSDVTFEERHDERVGGCGGRVVPCQPEPDRCEDCGRPWKRGHICCS